MKTTFKKIFEHDMDLLIIEEFLCNRLFADLFLKKTGLKTDYTDCDAYHSLSDNDGESDITIILHYNDKKHAILIEDKIDAQAMPEQSDRYIVRAKKQIQSGMYDSYNIFITAPSSYITKHKDDKNTNYHNIVTYEEMIDFFRQQNDSRSFHKADMIEFAISEKTGGYIVNPDAQVSEFWRNLRAYCSEHFGSLEMLGEDTEKGAAAIWPEFKTALKGVVIVFKSDKGYVDLQFPCYGAKINILYSCIKHLLDDDMGLYPAGKSASIRLRNDLWKIDFKAPFEENTENIHSMLKAVERLYQLTLQINYNEIYQR